MKKFAYVDGENLVVCIPNPEFVAELMREKTVYAEDGTETVVPGMKEEEAYKFILAKDCPEGAQEITEMPEDRYFREAWRIGYGIVSVDMEKARQVHMEVIRKERDKKLKALDVEQLKGVDVQGEKQTLRDIPQTFDLSTAQTPEELKALWPAELAKS
jgi:hypothetical protein